MNPNPLNPLNPQLGRRGMTASRRQQLRGALEGVRQQNAACPEPPLADFEAGLEQWLEQRCLYQECYSGGVVSLHLDYVLWCGQELEVPCSLPCFRGWLVVQGFQLSSFGLVYGLVLKVDLNEQTSKMDGGREDCRSPHCASLCRKTFCRRRTKNCGCPISRVARCGSDEP